MKRLFDIVFSALALLILSPVLIPIMVILRFSGEGEIFYRQERIGKGNKPFYITKFATMLKDSPNMEGGSYTLQNDPRVLPIGRFLRKSKINEFPQFWDILVGNMSFVGPRPQMTKVTSWYPEKYKEVLDAVRPGLTGVGSIVFRDEEAILSRAADYDYCYKNEIIPYKTELELWYKDNTSFLTDIVLMVITAWVVIFPESQILFKIFPSLPKADIGKFGMGAEATS
ncbi:sugar transferase [Emcibacter sp.]|uniref:sugar transferase n=1 Tax=Emcibacter sp. TaxID=1979954 RepID=UPI003A8D74C5